MKASKEMKWEIHLDREESDDEAYSITLNKEYGGWNTDSGYPGYGLPKELAEWICQTLNDHGKNCPYKMDDYGYWKKEYDK